MAETAEKRHADQFSSQWGKCGKHRVYHHPGLEQAKQVLGIAEHSLVGCFFGCLLRGEGALATLSLAQHVDGSIASDRQQPALNSALCCVEVVRCPPDLRID